MPAFMRLQSPEQIFVIQPRAGSRRMLVWHHSAGTASPVVDQANNPEKLRLLMAAADAGYTVVGGTFGGVHTWANYWNQKAIADVIAWAGTNLDVRTDKVAHVGESMGFQCAARYCATFPSATASLVGLIPAADAEWTYDNTSFSDEMDDAYRPSKVRDVTSMKSNSTVTTVDFVLTGLTVGNYLVIRTAADNAGTNGAASTVAVTNQSGSAIDTATDQAFQANVDPGAASAGATCNLLIAKITAASGTVRVTYGNAVVQAAVAEEWTGIHGTTPIVGTPVTGTGTASTNLASTADASVAVGNVAYGATAIEGPEGDTITKDADTTNGSWVELTKNGTTNGTAATNQTTYGAYKLVTSTGGQTHNPTINNARDSAGIIAELARQSWADASTTRDPSLTAIYSALDPFPVRLWSASDDAVVSGASALATLIGANGSHTSLGTGGHADATLDAITADDFVAALNGGIW